MYNGSAALPVNCNGSKSILAPVRAEVSLTSIRWREASLILYARYAGIMTGSMPHLENRLPACATLVAYGHARFKPYLLHLTSLIRSGATSTVTTYAGFSCAPAGITPSFR